MDSTEDAKNVWVTRDGRRLPVSEIDDDHLRNIVTMGLRSLARQCRNESLECLAGGAGGDDGTQYFAGLQSDEYMELAGNRRELLRRLAGSKRYGPVVSEARVRARSPKTVSISHMA
jgi:hypothetical protein